MHRRSAEDGRADDREDVIQHRLRLFDELTPPMLDYYANRETLLTIDGAKSVAEVTRSVIAELEQLKPRLS